MADRFALLRDGVAAEIITVPAGSPPIQQMFHPAMVAQMRRLEGADRDAVAIGWTYDGTAWVAPAAVAPVIAYVPPSLARERLEADGFWDEFSAILASNPAAMLKVLTLRDGIDPTDPQAVALIGASGASPARILAPPGTVLEPLAPVEPDPPVDP
jgi:hypothetical protein